MTSFSSLLRPSSWLPSFQKLLQRTTMTNSEGKEKVFYFAYGSNLSLDRIRIQNKSAVFKNVGLLRGYKLDFCYKSNRWGGSAADIIPGHPDSSYVYGVVWELEESDLVNLDKQEGVGHEIYKRITVSIDVDGILINCLAYQLTDKTRNKSLAEAGENQRPSRIYKSVIVKGAKEHQLPAGYVAFLENMEDCGEDGYFPGPNLS